MLFLKIYRFSIFYFSNMLVKLLLHKQQHLTQKQLSIKAQLAGYDFITETAIIKSERGSRFVPDYKVAIFAELLCTTPEYLLKFQKEKQIQTKHFFLFPFATCTKQSPIFVENCQTF